MPESPWFESLFGAPPGEAALTSLRPYGLTGWLEALCWIGLLIAGVLLLPRLRTARVRIPRIAWALLATAVATRLAVPRVNYNWYFDVPNLPASMVFGKGTTYLPLPNRLAGFASGAGFEGIVILNLALGVASVLLLWHLGRRAGLGERVSAVLAFLLAATPMYVRLAASDTSQVLILFLWLLSGVALAAVRDHTGGAATHVALFCATVAACPIRLESALMMPSVALLVGGGPAGWRDIARHWRRYLSWWVALAIGIAVTLSRHGHSIQAKLLSRGEQPLESAMLLLASLLVVPFRVVGLMNVSIVSYLPIVIAVPILYELVHCWRRGEWNAMLSTFGPPLILSLPFAFARTPIITDLSSSSYNIIYVVFLLIACAKGLARMYDEFRAGALLRERGKRVAAVALLIPAAWFFVVVPYRWTYVFQEERGFLDRHLPQRPATVATIWDGRSTSGDWDCSLAQPYPLFLASHPGIKWVVLSQSDLDIERLRRLDFDYYYSGTLVLLDPDKPTPWSLLDLTSPAEMPVPDSNLLRDLRRIDEAIRERHQLQVVATEQVPARWQPLLATGCTGVTFGYPTAEVELTLYRSVN